MPDGAFDENRQIGGATADIDEDSAALALLFGQHDIAGRQRVEDEAIRKNTC